ncbi:hypothetical protein D3C80_1845160 [compost metagenome]
MAGYAATCPHPDAGCVKNETFTDPLRLVKMLHVELFTQHRFKATIGLLLKRPGITPPFVRTIESQGEPA